MVTIRPDLMHTEYSSLCLSAQSASSCSVMWPKPSISRWPPPWWGGRRFSSWWCLLPSASPTCPRLSPRPPASVVCPTCLEFASTALCVTIHCQVRTCYRNRVIRSLFEQAWSPPSVTRSGSTLWCLGTMSLSFHSTSFSPLLEFLHLPT